MLKKADYSLFLPFLQQGVLVDIQVGCSIHHLLCKQFGVTDDYLANRIKTLFLDGKPVDDAKTAMIRDGSTLALSGAMPGLVGATFRRGGVLASFRSSITHAGDGEFIFNRAQGRIKIKLFNLLLSELGPQLLNKGVWVQKVDLEAVLRYKAVLIGSSIISIEINGQQMAAVRLAEENWVESSNRVFLRVWH
jgi:hypothetical protein